LTDLTISEHHKIANFAALRVFPMLDEFAYSHNLTVSPDSGLLVLLAKRLVHRGTDPEAVTALVQAAVTHRPKPSEPPAPPPMPPPPPEGENIVSFPKRQK
jgi:hypothetical protein